jgi:uncharacterized protein (TIGR03067 family)
MAIRDDFPSRLLSILAKRCGYHCEDGSFSFLWSLNVKSQLFTVFAAFLLIAADDPKDDAKNEMKKLEGTWTTVSAISDGKKVPDEKVKVVKLTMKADGTWTMTNGADTWGGTYTVDPSKKPKTGQFIGTTDKFKDSTTLDIYEIEGDTLTFCYVIVPTGKESTKERPTKFESKEGSGHYLYVMKREKSK